MSFQRPLRKYLTPNLSVWNKLRFFVSLSEEVLKKWLSLILPLYQPKDHYSNTTLLFLTFFSQLKNHFIVTGSLGQIQFLVFKSFSIINFFAHIKSFGLWRSTGFEWRPYCSLMSLGKSLSNSIRGHISEDHQSKLNKFLIRLKQRNKIGNYFFVSTCITLNSIIRIRHGEECVLLTPLLF